MRCVAVRLIAPPAPDVLLLSAARDPAQLRAIGERLGSPLMYLTGRGGLAGLGVGLAELGSWGYRIVADPTTALLAAFSAWQQVYAHLASDFGAGRPTDAAWSMAEAEMLEAIDLNDLLRIERETVETDPRAFVGHAAESR